MTLRQERRKTAGMGGKSVRQHRISNTKGLGGKLRSNVKPGLLPSLLCNRNGGSSGKKNGKEKTKKKN